MEIKMIMLSLMLFMTCSSKEDTKNKENVLQENENYYKIKSKGNQYVVEWGNNTFKNITKEPFDYATGELNLVNSGKDAIVLSKSCGTSCRYYLILPMKKDANEKTYLFVKAYEKEKNLIAYVSEGTDSFITIENYITDKKISIKESELCPAAFKGDCIDKCYFGNNGKSFYIEWQGSKWSSKNNDKRKKKIDIKW